MSFNFRPFGYEAAHHDPLRYIDHDIDSRPL